MTDGSDDAAAVDGPTRAARDDAIDAFFRAMDAEDPEIVRPVLADGFLYRGLSGDFEGAEGLGRYLAEVRSISNVEHATTRRVHGAAASVVEGVATGRKEGDPFEARFCNVFEFRAADGGATGRAAGEGSADPDGERIRRVTVYLNDA